MNKPSITPKKQRYVDAFAKVYLFILEQRRKQKQSKKTGMGLTDIELEPSPTLNQSVEE